MFCKTNKIKRGGKDMEMRRRGGGYALVTICGGIGEAECMILKVEA